MPAARSAPKGVARWTGRAKVRVPALDAGKDLDYKAPIRLDWWLKPSAATDRCPIACSLGGTDYRLRQRFNTEVRMPGYTGVANDPGATGALDSALTSYLSPRTDGPFTLSSGSMSTGGFFNTPGGAACPQP